MSSAQQRSEQITPIDTAIISPLRPERGEPVTIEIGVDSFAALMPDPRTGVTPSPAERMSNLLEEIEVADRAGLDAFGIGEHHRADFSSATRPQLRPSCSRRVTSWVVCRVSVSR